MPRDSSALELRPLLELLLDHLRTLACRTSVIISAQTTSSSPSFVHLWAPEEP
jgi:hypothetical protein